MKTDPKERFSDRVKNYVKYRPHYPIELLTFLINECGLTESSVIADIGSGTGISAEMFIENGNMVFAVEPNMEMRKAAEKFFSGNKNFISIDTSAESTGLSENSIDFVIAGQAFHWFDAEKCKTEFKRILKDDGYLIIIWNSRIYTEGFLKEYDEFLIKFGTDYVKVNHENFDDAVIKKFYQPNEVLIKKFYNFQDFDYDGLKGRLLSSSYVPNVNDLSFDEMLKALEKLFDKHNSEGIVKMEYETVVYLGRL
ncbi:MAG TPA: class I SAM-dependent methyltransferase [Ignavibacteria bacterium]|nr:class I SAM-dependent methyltransferase [Ignavibacteria bacterium]HQY51327.1 class I SAM-dependent methyltransferase [Ignavibacteria bacterium]HRB00529.1 class I SAM-dependent methyltransferase [Ignavibacteria bacterium]